jgi:hypothetical protein
MLYLVCQNKTEEGNILTYNMGKKFVAKKSVKNLMTSSERNVNLIKIDNSLHPMRWDPSAQPYRGLPELKHLREASMHWLLLH